MSKIKITEQQKCKLMASLVEHQDAFSDLSIESAQWVIQNTKEAVEVASKVWEEHKNYDFIFITEFVIVVPNDYEYSTYIKLFRRKNKTGLYYYNNDITDENFKIPYRILKPGDMFICKVFFQRKHGVTTSEERLAFYKAQNAIFLGIQGVCLVYEQQKDKLPKGKWYCSFDKKERLWKDSGSHRVPYIDVYSDGDFRIDIGYFEKRWSEKCALLCFYKKNK